MEWTGMDQWIDHGMDRTWNGKKKETKGLKWNDLRTPEWTDRTLPVEINARRACVVEFIRHY